jgi:propionate catabolism operon transcriptional regulator
VAEQPATLPPATADPGDRQILHALEAHRWRKHEAARHLGMSRTTLWRRMKEMGLE